MQVSPSLGKKKQNRLSSGKLATSFSATELLSFICSIHNSYLSLSPSFQVLAEFQGVQEHRQFMKNIGKEKELKSRIKDLQRFVPEGTEGTIGQNLT